MAISQLPDDITTWTYEQFREVLLGESLDILREAASGRGPDPHYVTSYQVIARLPPRVRDELIRREGDSGAGVGWYSSAAAVVGGLLAERQSIDVDFEWFDARDARFRREKGAPDIMENLLKAGSDVIGLYRIKRADKIS
ncbi:MAG: hypothetical protein ACHREM_12480 [Polyangiales bacterium]